MSRLLKAYKAKIIYYLYYNMTSGLNQGPIVLGAVQKQSTPSCPKELKMEGPDLSNT